MRPTSFFLGYCSEYVGSPLEAWQSAWNQTVAHIIGWHLNNNLVCICQAIISPSASVGCRFDRQTSIQIFPTMDFQLEGVGINIAEEPGCVYPEGMNSALMAFAEFDCFHLCLIMLTGAAWHQKERRLIHNCVPWVYYCIILIIVEPFLSPFLFLVTFCSPPNEMCVWLILCKESFIR